MQRDRLAAADLAARRDRAGIHLAVQAKARLARNQVQRIAASGARAEPFRRLDPARVRRTIVVTEARDLLRIKLDAAGRRRQLVALRIGAEAREQHVLVGARRNFKNAVLPEAVEVGDRCRIAAYAVAPAVVEVAQPTHRVAAGGVGFLATEPAREIAEDRKIVARLAED